MEDEIIETVAEVVVKLLTRLVEAAERAYPPPKPPKPPRPPQVSALSREPVLIFDTIPVGKRGPESYRESPCAAANSGTTDQCLEKIRPGTKFCDRHDDKSRRVGTIAWEDVTEADVYRRLCKKREEAAERERRYENKSKS